MPGLSAINIDVETGTILKKEQQFNYSTRLAERFRKQCQKQNGLELSENEWPTEMLICCSNRIVDLRYDLQDQILRKSAHCRPVFDVWSELDLNAWICNALAVKDTVLINCFVEEIFLMSVASGKFFCGSQEAFVCCCCCDGTCIHKCNGCDLSALKLRAFTVREVSG